MVSRQKNAESGRGDRSQPASLCGWEWEAGVRLTARLTSVISAPKMGG